MKNVYLIILSTLGILLLSACKKEPCIRGISRAIIYGLPINVAFYGFQPEELLDFEVTKYKGGTNFQEEVDFYKDTFRSVKLLTDSVAVQYANSNYKPFALVYANYDYKLVLPRVNVTYLIGGAKEGEKKSIPSFIPCGETGYGYTTPMIEYPVDVLVNNNEPVFYNDTLNIFNLKTLLLNK